MDTQNNLTPVQQDLAKIELALTNLVAAGEDLFADEIAALRAKRDALIAQVEEEVTTAVVDAVKEAQRTFIEKYGAAVAHAAEIALLAAILGRLIGVM